MRKRNFLKLQMTITAAAALAAASGLMQGCAPAASSEAAESAGIGRPDGIPVRISREFFEKDVTAGVLLVSASGAKLLDESSSTYFEELPPPGPAPQGDVIADYRDRPACSRLQGSSLGAMSVCFTVAPDVSSVDVTGRKVSLEGAGSVLRSADPSCSDSSPVTFKRAVKTARGVAIHYEAACAAPVVMQIELRAI
jgi:hypothetical protein